jgi:regulatory protein SWI6
MLSETEVEFNRELEAQQDKINKLHRELRDASSDMGARRRRLEAAQAAQKERKTRELKIHNLQIAVEEQRSRLLHMQQQYGQMDGEVSMKLGDADEGLAIPAGALPANILSNINPNSHQPLVLDQAQRQLLASTLPPAHVLRARVNAYKSNNQELEEGVRGLQAKSSDLAAKYRRIIASCIQAPEDKVDTVLENLLRAVESENDVELGRVREFLSRVDGVE